MKLTFFMNNNTILQDTKQNANYENLVYDKVEKRVTKNLLYDSCLTLELHNKFFVTLFSTLSYTKFP